MRLYDESAETDVAERARDLLVEIEMHRGVPLREYLVTEAVAAELDRPEGHRVVALALVEAFTRPAAVTADVAG
mgnify:CR=1 FL=1